MEPYVLLGEYVTESEYSMNMILFQICLAVCSEFKDCKVRNLDFGIDQSRSRRIFFQKYSLILTDWRPCYELHRRCLPKKLVLSFFLAKKLA